MGARHPKRSENNSTSSMISAPRRRHRSERRTNGAKMPKICDPYSIKI